VTTDPSSRRDAHLRLVRRLRVGVVSASVLSSLGVAGVVASSGSAGTPPTSAPGTTSGNVGDDSFSQWQDDSGELSDDSGGLPSQQVAPPTLQQGFGPSHGSTGGS
jgi:hypothetical protein